jgi:signal transduction histidine kinase
LNVEGQQAFDDLDKTSLEIIAEYLGVAIVNARLAEQAQQLALIQQRQRLSRDLHDNVTQILASISLIAQSLSEAWRREPSEGERRSGRLSELAGLALGELRAMLHELSPDSVAPAGGLDAFPPLEVRLHRLLGMMVPPQVALRLETSGLTPQADHIEEAMLRVCQEAVSNAVRHGAPSVVRVRLKALQGVITLAVADDGRGLAQTPGSGGMGLRNMSERVQECGGRLRLFTSPARGTTLMARMPRVDISLR